MKFVMWVCVDESLPVDPQVADATAWDDELARRGVLLARQRLHGTADATTVREHGRLVTDGPFAETREQIAGYGLLECDDLRHAVEIASTHPAAAFGVLELRQVWPE